LGISDSHYSARAILESLGESPKTHKGTISLFGEKVIKGNLMDKVFGRYLSQGYRKRQSADYDGMMLPEEDEVAKMIVNAEKFLRDIEGIIKEKLAQSQNLVILPFVTFTQCDK